MIYTISKGDITASINSLGAELYSLKKGETEYLWQGNPAYWNGRAYNLFPIVARLTGETYTYQGNTYKMAIHGFVRKTEMQVSAHTKTSITFTMTDSEATRASYPFAFRFSVRFTITKKGLKVSYVTQNTGKETLPFSVGGHPGFNVPFGGDGNFEDYYLEFGKACSPDQIEISPRGLFTGKKTAYRLQNGNILPLSHKLFEVDGIFLSRMDSTVTLKSGKSERSVTLEYPEMPYLGVWHSAKSEAPFVCIEPWCGLPGYDGEMEDINTRHDMFHILPGKTQVAQFSMTFQ